MSLFPPIQNDETTIEKLNALLKAHALVRGALMDGEMTLGEGAEEDKDPIRIHAFACLAMAHAIFEFGMAQLVHRWAFKRFVDDRDLGNNRASSLFFSKEKLKELGFVQHLFDSEIWKRIEALQLVRNTVMHSAGWHDIDWEPDQMERLRELGFIIASAIVPGVGWLRTFRVPNIAVENSIETYRQAISLAHVEFEGKINADT